ncbi:phosphoglycerate mutase family protein [soil metagenome]
MKSARGWVGVRPRALWLPAILAGLFTLATASSAWAQATIFVIRHAERADQVEGGTAMMTTDPDLSAVGQARAESLAAMLKDAGITTIFVTQYKRTQQTAAPLATALGVTPEQVGSREVDALAQQLRAASGSILVVGHSNSVPNLLKALGTGTSVEIAETEYDNLFIVTLGGEKPTVARLRYR